VPLENAAKLKTVSKSKVIKCNTVSIYTYWGWRCKANKGKMGVLTSLQNIQEGISVILCPTALPRPSGIDLCSLFLQAVHPIHRSTNDESLWEIHQMGNTQLAAWQCMVVFWYVLMLVRNVCGYPSTRGRSLLEVGVVGKSVDILLDHFVAELVLLLRRGWKKRPHQLKAPIWFNQLLSHWSVD